MSKKGSTGIKYPALYADVRPNAHVTKQGHAIVVCTATRRELGTIWWHVPVLTNAIVWHYLAPSGERGERTTERNCVQALRDLANGQHRLLSEDDRPATAAQLAAIRTQIQQERLKPSRLETAFKATVRLVETVVEKVTTAPTRRVFNLPASTPDPTLDPTPEPTPTPTPAAPKKPSIDWGTTSTVDLSTITNSFGRKKP